MFCTSYLFQLDKVVRETAALIIKVNKQTHCGNIRYVQICLTMGWFVSD